ncbi:hypothetical protein [Sphingobacterium bovistauri]|uniref:Outer membrane protein beta-barrel domain-containing protein n=1 Tax=Sphingobacterium bovistauri TaxID=2781959 RepID=A0ABS7Z098_9SPHI|nr:hypothetical protein [Sphingobacterium bovistauri]MCA5003592.1 hypothetical protein [Sphingobacterium bovistauri]
MKKRIFLFCCQLTAMGYLMAQTDVPSVGQGFQLNKMSLQLQGGTNGFGAGIRYQVLEKLAVRLNGTYFKHQMDNPLKGRDINIAALGDFKDDIQYVNGSVSQVGLLGEYSVLSMLRIVAGGAVINNTEVNGFLKPTKGMDFGNLTISPEQIGTLAANVSFNGFAPYIGLGIGKSTPNKRFGVNVDLGSYYMSAAKVQIDATKLLAPNKNQESLLENNLSTFRWMPTLQVNLNFKLGN